MSPSEPQQESRAHQCVPGSRAHVVLTPCVMMGTAVQAQGDTSKVTRGVTEMHTHKHSLTHIHTDTYTTRIHTHTHICNTHTHIYTYRHMNIQRQYTQKHRRVHSPKERHTHIREYTETPPRPACRHRRTHRVHMHYTHSYNVHTHMHKTQPAYTQKDTHTNIYHAHIDAHTHTAPPSSTTTGALCTYSFGSQPECSLLILWY